jgi:hypothetical protein
MDLQPEIYLHLGLAFLVAVLFYLLIPGAGAFYVRSSWRRFRRALLQSVRFPIADYQTVHGRGDGFLGCYRFFGRLQAFAGDQMVWLTDGRTSIRVHLQRVQVYILPPIPSPSIHEGRYRFPDESPRRVEWDRIGPLPEYIKFFIAGGFYKEQTGGYFTASAKCPLTVVIYEGEERDLLPQAIWTGRQRNEYWNIFTPWALAAGSLLLFIYFYVLIRNPALQLPAVTAASFALLPLIAFAPPGLLFYYVYRSLWRRGRELRSVRDLLRIPTTLCAAGEQVEEGRPGCRLPNGEKFIMEQFSAAPGEEVLGEELWQLDVPETGAESEGYFVFSAERGEGEVFRSPSDPAARAVLVPGNPYELSVRCEKKAFHSEAVAVLLFLAGTLLNGFILFTVLMLLLR